MPSDWKLVKLAIGLCNNQDKIDADFFWNFISLHKPYRCQVFRADAHIKATSLNMLVEMAWRWGAEKILFFDIDMRFPLDTIPKLLRRNLPIVSGLYHLRKFPYSPVAGWISKNNKAVNQEGKNWKLNYVRFPDNPQHLIEVDWCGIGCLLVDMDVFNKIYWPSFRDIWDKSKGRRKVGHDNLFCREVKKAGYKIYVDTSVNCIHTTHLDVDQLWIDAFYKSNFQEIYNNLIKEETQTDFYWDRIWLYEKEHGINRIYTFKELKPYLDKIPKGSSVADVGCGQGIILKYLKDTRKCECFGYDISPYAIEQLEHQGIDGMVADFRTYEPDEDSADYIIASHILEHMKDDKDFVRKIAKMTKKEALFSVPIKNLGITAEIEHQRLYTEKSFRKLLETYFKNVEIEKLENAFIAKVSN